MFYLGSEKQQQKYAYAETYEDFIKMINTTTDIDTLKQLRYHTIAEIMQATVIHNTKVMAWLGLGGN